MPLQHAAAVALGFSSEYYGELQRHYLYSRDHLYESLQMAGFQPVMPAGAYYMMADISSLQARLGASDDYRFSLALIDQYRVATVPGSSFYSDPALGRHIVRFCFCKKWETLHQVREQLLPLQK